MLKKIFILLSFLLSIQIASSKKIIHNLVELDYDMTVREVANEYFEEVSYQFTDVDEYISELILWNKNISKDDQLLYRGTRVYITSPYSPFIDHKYAEDPYKIKPEKKYEASLGYLYHSKDNGAKNEDSVFGLQASYTDYFNDNDLFILKSAWSKNDKDKNPNLSDWDFENEILLGFNIDFLFQHFGIGGVYSSYSYLKNGNSNERIKGLYAKAFVSSELLFIFPAHLKLAYLYPVDQQASQESIILETSLEFRLSQSIGIGASYKFFVFDDRKEDELKSLNLSLDIFF